MARVEFRNVSKRFDEHTLALQQFSLSVEDSEFMVLVGPSGCGKTTALRLLAGLEEVTEGEIAIDGKVVNERTPQQRNVAMVFQNYALYPHMTVRANLEFPLRMAHLPTRLVSEKVTRIAGILNLTDLLQRKPRQLSGGQRQRVAMGRALVRNPSVFLLDEPLSNLDARLRAQIRAEIAQLQRQLQKTTLYVTHDQVEAMTLGHRVAVMNAGQLQQVGTPEQLYADPQNIFVAKFIGSPGMNILPATLVCGTDGQPVVRFGQQTIPLLSSKYRSARGLASYIDQSIFIGIRPEAIHYEDSNNATDIKLRVLTTEFLGHESLLYCQLPDATEASSDRVLIARINGQYHGALNSENRLFIDLETIYLFDQQGQIIQGDNSLMRKG